MHQLEKSTWGLILLLGLGLGPAALAAQSWQGSLALGLEVQNDRKQVVPGARVMAEFAEVEPYDGPEAVTTDESGRAVLYGLAEGLWRIQVEREGYSRYLAVVRLDAKKKKVVITAGPLRDATAPPLTIDFSKTESTRVAPRPEPRRDRDRRADRRRPSRDEPRAERGDPEPDAEPRPRAEPERRVEPRPEPPPTPEPPPEPESEPTPATEEPVAPEPAAPEPPEPSEPSEPSEPPPTPSRDEPVELAPEPEVESMPEADPEPTPEPDAEPAAPAPAPEPEPVPEPAPEPEPVPEPAPEPTLPPSPMRSTSNGTCGDCKPGEAAVSARFRAASRTGGSSGCPADVDDRIREAIEALAASPTSGAAEYVGPLVDGGRVLPWADPAAVAAAQRLLDPWLTPEATCQVSLVVLSPNVKFTGYRYQAADPQAGGDCLAGQDCPIGDARWPDHPRIEKTDAGTFVFSTFENRSTGWERRGELTVYFKP